MFDKTQRHVIAESSLLKATKTGRIVNLVDVAADVDNGKLVTKGEYLRDEVYAMGTPEQGDKVYLTLQVPLIYEGGTLDKAEYNFYNGKGELVRSYPLEADDIFTVSVEGIKAIVDGAPVVGNLVVADGRDIKEVAAATDTALYGFVGRIIAKVAKTGTMNYRIEVVKNQQI